MDKHNPTNTLPVTVDHTTKDKPLKNPLPLIYAGVVALTITAATILMLTGHDLTGLVGLLPVIVTSIITLERVHKVEKNTNGTMSKLVDAALQNKDTTPKP
jgi:ABC-type siderophore export system fused ATPase/permease subunit